MCRRGSIAAARGDSVEIRLFDQKVFFGAGLCIVAVFVVGCDGGIFSRLLHRRGINDAGMYRAMCEDEGEQGRQFAGFHGVFLRV